MDKVVATNDGNPHGRIVVATQAVEAGVDISAAVMFTEIAPWSSMVQRFGRANRYAELPDRADVHWIDLLGSGDQEEASDKDAVELAIPYTVAELQTARERLTRLTDVAPARLPPPDDVAPPRRVIRRKDLDDLFDTDSDLTGFDVDVSPYVRDADDTDIRVFWRDLPVTEDSPPRPRREELCAVSIGAARTWLSKLRARTKGNLLFQRDPQWRRRDGRTGTAPPGWSPFREEPWPGLILLADRNAGGYREAVGFTGDPKDRPEPVADSAAPTLATATPSGSGSVPPAETEGHDEDSLSQIDTIVPLADHLRHVTAEAETLWRRSRCGDPHSGDRGACSALARFGQSARGSSRTRCVVASMDRTLRPEFCSPRPSSSRDTDGPISDTSSPPPWRFLPTSAGRGMPT